MIARKKPLVVTVGVVVGLAVLVFALAPVADSYLIDRAVPAMGSGSKFPSHIEFGFKFVRPVGEVAMKVRAYYDYWRWVRGALSDHPLPARDTLP